MEAIPNEAQAKREALEKGVQELMMLKEQVSMKRRQLKVMGLMEEPEVYKKTVKYPDLQAKYKQKKEAKPDEAAPTPAPASVVPAPTPKASVPADSPFMDPKAPKKEAPKQEPVKHQEAAQTPAPAPVAAASTPIPVPVKAARVEVKPMRIGIDGRWLF